MRFSPPGRPQFVGDLADDTTVSVFADHMLVDTIHLGVTRRGDVAAWLRYGCQRVTPFTYWVIPTGPYHATIRVLRVCPDALRLYLAVSMTGREVLYWYDRLVPAVAIWLSWDGARAVRAARGALQWLPTAYIFRAAIHDVMAQRIRDHDHAQEMPGRYEDPVPASRQIGLLELFLDELVDTDDELREHAVHERQQQRILDQLSWTEPQPVATASRARRRLRSPSDRARR